MLANINKNIISLFLVINFIPNNSGINIMKEMAGTQSQHKNKVNVARF